MWIRLGEQVLRDAWRRLFHIKLLSDGGLSQDCRGGGPAGMVVHLDGLTVLEERRNVPEWNVEARNAYKTMVAILEIQKLHLPLPRMFSRTLARYRWKSKKLPTPPAFS